MVHGLQILCPGRLSVYSRTLSSIPDFPQLNTNNIPSPQATTTKKRHQILTNVLVGEAAIVKSPPVVNHWFIFIDSLFSYSKNRVSWFVSLVSSTIDCDKITSVEMIHMKHVDCVCFMCLKILVMRMMAPKMIERRAGKRVRETRVKTSICHTFHAWTVGHVELVALWFSLGTKLEHGERKKMEPSGGAKGLDEFFMKTLVFFVTTISTVDFLDKQGISSSQLILIQLCGKIHTHQASRMYFPGRESRCYVIHWLSTALTFAYITFRFIEIHAHFDTESENQEVRRSISANCLHFSLTAVNSSGDHLRARPVHLKGVWGTQKT